MHYYHHHIGDFLKATSRLTDAQSMAYLRLLWMYYDSEKPLPDDLEVLAFQVGTDTKTVELILLSFFKRDESAWRHTRCDKEIEEYRQLIHKKRNAGKASAERRSNSSSTGVEQVSNSVLTGVQLTNNHKPITNNQIKDKSAARGTRMLPNFEMPDEWFDFCKQHRPELNPNEVFESFRDYWVAMPGQKGAKADWMATWRNWVRNTRVSTNTQQPKKDGKLDLLLGRRQPDFVDVIDADYQEKLNVLSGPSF